MPANGRSTHFLFLYLQRRKISALQILFTLVHPTTYFESAQTLNIQL